MTARKIGRRRFLKIAATVFGGVALPALARLPRPQRHVRKGVLLGAETEIQLYHPDARAAEAAIDACFTEVQRLEAIFSLYQPDSALSRLNRDGRLIDAPPELAALINQAAEYSRATNGAFDITVQPLWDLYARHFAMADASTTGPAPSDIQRALSCVGYRRIQVSDRSIGFSRPGMAVTLNGIAQGFITDRVAEMLRASGFGNVLVNMGEMRALGRLPDGTPWRIGIADPEKPWRSLSASVPVTDCAIATSGGYGTPFDASGHYHHLFDPHTGHCVNRYRSVSVIAADATTADALSTACCALAPTAARDVLLQYPGVCAIFIDNTGEVRAVGSASPLRQV